MLIPKLKIKQSLGLRVLVTNIAIATTAVAIIGLIVYSRVSTTVINEKIAISKVETRNALELTQGHFNISRFQDECLYFLHQQGDQAHQQKAVPRANKHEALFVCNQGHTANFFLQGPLYNRK